MTTLNFATMTSAQRLAAMAELAKLEGVKVGTKPTVKVSVEHYTTKGHTDKKSGRVVGAGKTNVYGWVRGAGRDLCVSASAATALLAMEKAKKGSIEKWLQAIAVERPIDFGSIEVK